VPRYGPARPVVGERKGGSGCAPGPGVSQRSRPAGPRCHGAARSALSVCAGPGGEPSRAEPGELLAAGAAAAMERGGGGSG